MPVDELIDQLASLSLRDGPALQEGTSEKLEYKNKGEHAIKQLEAHLARVRLGIAEAASPKSLGDAAKQEGKGLLKIAQAGLRNTTGGLEPLRLAYEASRALLPLSSFIVAADLTMERLWYKVASRSVELGDFALGLRASACLQTCLDQRKGDDLTKDATAGGGGKKGTSCSVVLASEGEEEALRLRLFAPPGASSSVALAKLVSGASLNACRCCLEVGTRETLRLMTGELGRGAGRWIDRVSELGDVATADSYRGLLFKQLWLGCAALEKPGLAATSSDCLVGRQAALGVLLRKGDDSWSADVFVAHALRAAVALQDRDASDSASAGDADAAELSAFCLEGLSDRDGEGWPAGVANGREEPETLHSSWVDWLQHSAGLHQKVGQAAEAQRLLQLAYEYVQRCRKRQPEPGAVGGHHGAAECAAYAGILKLHTAAMITSLHPPDGAAAAVVAVTSPPAGKQAAKKRPAGKKPTAEPPRPSPAVLALTSRGLDYLGDVVAALEALAEGEDFARTGAGAGAGAGTAAFIGAAVKAWTRVKKSCAVVALWADEGARGEAKDPGGLEHSQWSALSARGRLGLAELSLKLALVRERAALGRVLERLPPAASLFQLAVDSYIRVAHAHLGTLAFEKKREPATAGAGAGNVRTKPPQGSTAEEDARQALAAAERVLEVAGDVFPSAVSKRVGTGWFGLGTSLLDRGETDAGLNALVRGCRLLESWTEIERDQPGRSGADGGGGSSAPGVPEVLRSAQLDMRLAKLSLALQGTVAGATAAAAAAARALAFCPGMWCFSPEGQPESPAGALALVERFVACELRCSGPVDLEPGSAAGGVASVTAETLAAYLSDGAAGAEGGGAAVDLPTALEKRGFPPAAIVWALVAACRVYRAHLRKCFSDQAGSAGEEDGEEGGQGGTLLSACVEGHRLATGAVLGVCTRCRIDEEDDETTGWQNQADMWEAHARLLAAKFEHDLHLAGVAAIDRAAVVSADLPAGLQHATSGAAPASRLGGGGGGEDTSSGSPVAAAAGGVLACIRAMLHRAVAEHDDDAKTAMRESLDLFDRAARDPEWRPSYGSPANLGPAGVGSIADSLSLLEAHYTLHGDTLRRAKVAEVRLVLADRASSQTERESLPQGLASSASALAGVGAAFQAGGLPGLGPVYCAAADEEMPEPAGPERRGAGGIAGGERADSTGSHAKVESVRAAVDILRGMCLAEQRAGEDEGESVLLEARRAMSHQEWRAVAAPATAAYLECVAGLGLAWIYQRSGRLVEAMEEVRQAMRLCRTWASAGGPLTVSDKQIVALSAEKGRCIHDEGSDGRAAAGASQSQSQTHAEEGIGAEGGDTEDTIGEEGPGAPDGRGVPVLALGSRWIPVYLEGLTRMGRLWRERGIAPKASLTLRQGCVMSESLHAARFIRHCLLEEVEVAAGKHQFDRAERLLRASQELLCRERGDLGSAEGGASSPECASCQALDPASAMASGGAAGSAVKGKGSKRVPSKKPGGKKKTAAASPTVVVAGPAGGACLRCRELAVNAAELAAVEASLLRKRGSFEGALAACERGQAILAPLIAAAGEPVPVSWSGSLSSARESTDHGRTEGAGGDGLGWRAAEVLAILRLQQGRACCLLGNTAAGEELFQDCSHAEGAPALVRATALYRIGRMALDAGDAAGARLPLERSEALTRGAGAPKLVRKVRRVLAVTLSELAGQGGPRGVGIDASWRVAALSSLSVGVTHCNQVTHASARRVRKGDVGPELSAGMRLFDVVSGRRGATGDGCGLREGPEDICGEGCLKDAVTSDLRAEWPVVSLCVAPGEGASRRLLLTRLARERPPLTISVPLLPDDAQLLERWRGIMDENRDTLRGHSAEEAAKYGNQQKARWWERRVAVDEMLSDLLRELEERWFQAYGLAAVLLGDVVGDGLGLELEGVFEFAEERIRAALGGGASAPEGGKGTSRTKGGKRPRGAAAATGGGGGAEAGRERSSALSELVRVCVRGGEVMGEEAWLAVVRLALRGAGGDPSLAAEIAREIHEKVQAVFAADEVEFGRGQAHASAPDACPAGGGGDARWSPDSDIEKGRSSTSARRADVVQAAAATSRALTAPSARSIDEEAMSKMKVADLRRELSARGVPTTGLKLKADLLAKLAEVVRGEAGGNAADGGGADDGCAASPVGKSQDRGDVSVASRLSTPDGIGVATTAKTKGPAQSGSHTARTPAAGTKGNVGGGTGGGGGVGGRGGSGGRVAGAERHPVVLVLDEELQAIPWEGLPCLRGHAVTRVPAVPFVFAALETRWDGGVADGAASGRETSGNKGKGKGKPAPARNFEQPWIPSQGGVRLGKGYYILDPEANLPHTRKQLGPVFQGIGRRLGWSGVQGEAPTEDAMAQTLEEVDIFAYCGHGAGELLVGRDAVAGLTKCAVGVLMGCSSGRLKGYGDFEPTGMATSYLAGGSPAVVANLWDVTDKDIDRFSVALFEAFLGVGEGGAGKGGGRRALTLAHAVAESRSECKMPFIIGYAPVCYGIPVTVATSLPS